MATGRRNPDLVAGFAIGLYVIREALEIISRARVARIEIRESR
jgi:hypothetical protein